ncbi:MAG: DUF6263 family protein [Bacteroidota bacterium]
MRILLSIITLVALNSAVFAQSTELKYNLEKGKAYIAKSISTQEQTMTVQGMERNTETKSTSYLSLKMLDSKPDFFIAEVKFDTIVTEVSMPPMNISSADAGDINSEDPIEVTTAILNRLSNSTMVVRMDYSGKVQDIMNHQVIKNTVLQGTDSLKGQAAMAKGQLEMTVEKDALIGMIEGVTAHLPNQEVETGDKWESSFISKNGGVGMAISSTYVLKEISDGLVVIEGDVVVEPASSEPTMMNGAEITNKLRGLGKSTMELDSKTGWLKSSSSKISLSGDMIIKAPGQNMTLPIETIITGETIAIE